MKHEDAPENGLNNEAGSTAVSDLDTNVENEPSTETPGKSGSGNFPDVEEQKHSVVAAGMDKAEQEVLDMEKLIFNPDKDRDDKEITVLSKQFRRVLDKYTEQRVKHAVQYMKMGAQARNDVMQDQNCFEHAAPKEDVAVKEQSKTETPRDKRVADQSTPGSLVDHFDPETGIGEPGTTKT
jgi:hypothetical protein